MFHPLRHHAYPAFWSQPVGHAVVLSHERLPQTLPYVACRSSVNSRHALPPYVKIAQVPFLHGCSLYLYRQRRRAPRAQSHTRLRQHTSLAVRCRRRTNHRSEVHHPLVVGRCLFPRQQLVSQLCEYLFPLRAVHWRVDAEVSRQYAVHIAVDHRCGFIEGNRRDGRCGIVAYALQSSQALRRLRESPHLHHLSCRRQQVPRPRVVAQSLPHSQHLIFRRRRQCLHCGPAPHEPQPVRLPLLNACLLQDHLTQPDGICILRMAPGQVASVGGKPLQNLRSKSVQHTVTT